ncbi:MAG: SGNH/GDSL hydrolase family protein [Elusimicrobiales bacterium]|nr:SGNH/GDSL hydrolase family protein [Elusimicrobiales bacterium]
MSPLNLRRSAAACLSLLLGLAVLELTLRAAGWLLVAAQAWQNPSPSPLDRTEFRIVTLGESTTAQFWSGGRDVSWPGLLERYLNEAGLGRNFKVINLAKGGVSSFFLAEEFELNAGRLRPHAVISMMGVNDWIPYEYLRAPGAGSLRTVKAAVWLYRAAAGRLRAGKPRLLDAAAEARIEAGVRAALPQAARLASVPRLGADAAKRALELARQEGANGWHTLYCASKLLLYASGTASGDIKKSLAAGAFDLAALAVEQNPAHPALSRQLADAANLLPEKRGRTRELLLFAIRSGMQPDQNLLTYLLVLDVSDEPEVAAMLAARGMTVKKDGNQYQGTMAAYRRLAAAARRSGCAYLAMQYPTGKTAALRNLFAAAPKPYGEPFSRTIYEAPAEAPLLPEYEGIIFISNENFSELAGRPSSPSYREYFTDNFAGQVGGRFGHTTTKGHALIARNAANAIIAHWPQLARGAR